MRALSGPGLLVCAALVPLGLVGCHNDNSTPCPVYMTNHSGYRVVIEISQTREYCEDTEVFYPLDDSDSLFVGYYPRGYAFWLWGWSERALAADTARYIDEMVRVDITGKTLLLVDDSLGEPVLRVVH